MTVYRSRATLSSGVTLLELLVVLAILAGVAALASPVLSGSLAGQRVNAAARDIEGALRQARARAISTQQETLLIIDVTSHTYTVNGKPKSLALPEGATLVLNIARSETLREHRGSIRFFPDGSSTGGSVTVKRDALRRTVQVDWLTGLAKFSN